MCCENVTGVDKISYAKNTDLGGLNSNVKKLDIGELKTAVDNLNIL